MTLDGIQSPQHPRTALFVSLPALWMVCLWALRKKGHVIILEKRAATSGWLLNDCFIIPDGRSLLLSMLKALRAPTCYPQTWQYDAKTKLICGILSNNAPI